MAEALARDMVGSAGEADCLARVEARLETLRGGVRRVAEHVLTDPWGTRGVPILELARRVGVSENTVSRFCRALGYAGYRQFSMDLASTLGRLSAAAYMVSPEATESVAQDGALQIVRNVFAMEVQSLQETLRHLNRQAVEMAVSALHRARKVLVVGMGATAPAASTLVYRLALLGIDAVWPRDPYLLTAYANALTGGDAAVGISHPGRARLIGEMLRTARANGATTIALTAVAGSPVAQHADICITVAGSSPLFAGRQFAARVGGVVLAEALVAAVAWVRREGAPATVIQAAELTRELLEYGGE